MAQSTAEQSPLHQEILYTEDEVRTRIAAIALNIVEVYQDTDPLFVALMRGGAPFAAQLMTEITRHDPYFHPELDNMIVSTYGGGRQAGTPRVITDLSPTTVIEGRQVITVDDISDSGATFDYLAGHLKLAGASLVEQAVLIDRIVPKERTPEIACFRTGDRRWLIGMGMDDKGLGHEGGRWLPYVAVANSQPADSA
jgi:hypoxanthine phosphoribosyltransferase